MTIDHIKNILSQGEGIRNEFKQARDKLPENLFETICAMLNRSGGDIILGADDNGNLTGINATKITEMIAGIANLSNNPQKLNPPFILFPKEQVVDGFHIIHLQVPESSQVHQTANKIYDRSNDGDFVVRDAQQIAELYNRKRNHYTERTIYPAFRFEDFKQPLFDKVRKLIRGYNPEHPWLELDDEQMLRMAGLYDRDYKTGEEGYTLAAILLLGKDEAIRSVVPHYKIDALVRKFNVDRYDDRLYIQTNLIEAYEQLLEFVAKHLPDKFYLEGDQRRSLRTIIFREVAANILVHKEYTNAYPTSFVITKSAVITENANVPNGEGPININNFKPFPKNPVIAKFFMQLGRFDELGSGVLNINKYCKAYSGHDHPEFIEGAVFRTIIPLDDVVFDALSATDRINDALTDRINNNETGSDADIAEATDRINDASTDRIIRIREINDRITNTLTSKLASKRKRTVLVKLTELVQLVYWNPLLNAEELAQKIRVSVPTINRYLKILKTENVTELRGSRKKGGFTPTQEFRLEIEKTSKI